MTAKNRAKIKETVTARDLSDDGDGIALRSNGKTVFVPGLLPGEEALISIVSDNRSYSVGKIEKINELSKDRTAAPCPFADKCGGCTLQHLSYEGQLAIKRGKVVSCLERIGGFKGIAVDECVPSENILHYRNKLSFPVKNTSEGLVSGCFKARTHDVIGVDDCLLHSKKMMDCENKLLRFLRDENVRAYDETARKGCVRHIIVRESSDGSLLAGFVVADGSFPYDKARKKLCDAADSIVVNKNYSGTNVILGNETDILTGSGKITETILGKHFTVSAETFLQVNKKQSENLYRLAIEYADIQNYETVADLYCGIGTLSLCAAPFAGRIYGVEIVEQSVKNAQENAFANGIRNAEFICADAGEGFKKILEKEKNIDCVFVDPPRKGLSAETVQTVIKASPSRVVYVSCDPGTLARDLSIFSQNGYKIEKVTPVDMFPMTMHVETVVRLSRSDMNS